MTQKKFVVVLLVVIACGLILGWRDIMFAIEPMWYYNYGDWKTVDLDKVGTIMVPKEWIMTTENGILYFSNRAVTQDDCEIYMVQTDVTYQPTDEIPYVGTVSECEDSSQGGGIFGNGAYYRLADYELSVGDVVSKYTLEFSNYQSNGELLTYTFLCLSDCIDFDMATQIAASFRHY